ncbi:MAG: oligosaccharide flippase family protein [Candidatus Methanosuratincola sp.]|jgi:O-antigen/teichoic acid export membrane protein|nr:oligosaccharide flippase family protein [Candidatus Methanosuratincola sp.]
MSINKVIRSSLWLYVSGLVGNFLGFVYWLVATRFVGAAVIGDAAAVVGIVSVVSSVFGLGISSGLTRMVGRALGRGERDKVSVHLFSSLFLSILLSAVAAVLVYLLGGMFSIPDFEVPYVTVLILLSSSLPVLQAYYNARLRTSVIALSAVSASVLRLAIGLLLLYLGWSFTGVMAAYLISYAVQNIGMYLALRGEVSLSAPSSQSAAEAVRTGLPSWIPSLVATAGSWFGVLGIYGLSGNLEAGTYYVAFVIASIVFSLPQSLLGLMFPVLSGMEDGRKRATNRAILLTSAIVAPLAAAVIAYPSIPLSLLGTEYVASSVALQILLLAAFVSPIPSGFNSLIYAYGRYRDVTILGFAYNLPRILLYPFMVSAWGENGAAISYVLGFFVATAAVYFMAKPIGYSVGWKSALLVSSIPIAAAVPVGLLQFPWFIGGPLVLAISAISYARLGIVKKSDLAEISSAFISKGRVEQFQPYIRYVLEVLYGK